MTRQELTPTTRTLLLVEDDHDIRETIAEVLSEEGYTVACAATGLDALEYLRRADALPTVILLDLMMPVMDGLHFREEQRKNDAWAGIPVVVISADGNTRQKAESIGAARYLRKPINIDELLDLMSELCQPQLDETRPRAEGGRE